MQTNVIGTTVLLNAARNAWEQEDGTYKEGKKFLHVSTDEVYGSLEEDGTSFMRQHRIHHTARIQQVKHLQTCW